MIISLVGLGVNAVSGVYINDVIFNVIQKPLLYIGGSLPGVLTFMFISLVFWSIGLHGDNMIGGVFNPILTTLAVENLDAIKAGLEPSNIVNNTFHRAFFATGGTGCMLGLTIAMLIVCKRPENKSIARIALVPELFNIGEVSMFGVPICNESNFNHPIYFSTASYCYFWLCSYNASYLSNYVCRFTVDNATVVNCIFRIWG